MTGNLTIPQDRIFLVGFMGAGKTTVGKALAEILNYQFIDLDDLIQAATGKTVPDIFAELGEPYFRKCETDMLQACKTLEKTIIALGGGAYVSAENRKIIQGLGPAIWLDCPLAVIISRINFDGSRPLARGEDELSKLLAQRMPAYARADYHVDVGDKEVEEVVEAIIRLLQ
jgi:shikimate kinase